MQILLLIVILFLWIIALRFAVKISSDENINRSICELREIKLIRLGELQEKLNKNLLAKAEYKDERERILREVNRLSISSCHKGGNT